MPDRFRLILRYALDPGNAPEESARRLLQFVEESAAEEVMFLLAPEERSAGHITPDEATAWISEIRKVKPLLAERGATVSLNPWSTLYHSSRGRALHPGQDFRMMVGDNGVESSMSPCPWCANWRSYVAGYFVRLALEIDPTAIWIEDDWRLHNHDPALGFGGCYCASCLDRFSAAVGEPVDRQRLLARVLQPGAPHPWRKLWLDQCRQAILEPAADVARRVWQAVPGMRFGLMTSRPDTHSAEGRDWAALLSTWSTQEQFLVRPHLEPYTETPPISTWSSVARQTVSCCGQRAVYLTEIENSPRSGLYSGSHAYTKWKIERSLMLGAAGVTINHFDNTGMNTWYDRGLGAALGAQRARWDAVASLGIDDSRARGVRVLHAPDIARALDAPGPAAGMRGLVHDSLQWSQVFYTLGISHAFTTGISEDAESIYAVSGQTLRAFDDAAVERLLRHPLLLDLPSAELLLARGFGEQIGVQTIRRASLEEAAYAIEEVDAAFLGGRDPAARPRMCAQRIAPEIGLLDCAPGARVASTLLRGDLSPLAPASVVFENRLGGRVFTACHPLGGAQFYMAYFNRLRQEFFLNLLAMLHRGASGVTIASGHPLQVHAHDLRKGLLIGVTNVIYDTAERWSLHLPVAEITGRSWRHLDRHGRWQELPVSLHANGPLAEIEIRQPLPVLQTAFIHVA